MDELIEFQRKLWRWLGKLKAAKVKRSYFSTNAQTVFHLQLTSLREPKLRV